MTSLRMAFDQRGRRIVEVYDDRGGLVGAIYPTEDGSNAIHIVSSYFADEPVKPSEGALPVPGLLVSFVRRQR